jgi:hypothetical protein
MSSHKPKEKAMRKQGTTDAKRAAANDRPQNDKTEKAHKAPKPAEHFKLGDVSKVKRGFLKAVVDFTKKKGTVDAAILVEEFAGRQIDGAVGRMTISSISTSAPPPLQKHSGTPEG